MTTLTRPLMTSLALCFHDNRAGGRAVTWHSRFIDWFRATWRSVLPSDTTGRSTKTQIPLYTNPRTLFETRPDETHGQSPYMSRLSGQVDDQTKSADLLVWSGRVRVVEFRNDTARPDQRQSLVEFGHYTTRQLDNIAHALSYFGVVCILFRFCSYFSHLLMNKYATTNLL